ncbi:MAG: hypothetical protein II841_04830 [Bacteroidales bacterium]|nr:hypothetical protein [Bacteroidales bacterium]
MDNNTFRRWIDWKLGEARKDLAGGELDEKGRKAAKESVKWLEDAQRMAKYSAGQKFRQFRKDYERRLARLGPQFLGNYEREGEALKGEKQ